MGGAEMEGGGGAFLTLKPGVVAQMLSPARLTMQALSMWPEPTRLRWGLAVRTQHSHGRKLDWFPGQHVWGFHGAYLEST